MASRDFDSVYMLLSTLVTSRERNLHRLTRLGRGRGLSRANPFSSAVVHWAIQVRGKCYEVTSKDYHATAQRNEFEMRVSSVSEWEDRRRQHDLNFERKKIGATKYSDHQIQLEANRIWTSRFDTIYKIARQNCQNFAYLLFRRIKVKSEDDGIPAEERQSWKRVPIRLTQLRTFVKNYGQLLVTSTIVEHAEALAFTMFATPASSTVAAGAASILMITVIARIILAKGRDKHWLKEMKKAERLLADWQGKQPSPFNNSASTSSEDLAPPPYMDKEIITTIVQAAEGKLEDSVLAQEIREALQESSDAGEDPGVYQGYNKEMINDFCLGGFEPHEVVAALLHWDIGTFGGEYFTFDEEDTVTMFSVLQEVRSQTQELMLLAYQGYNKEMVDAYVEMGFRVQEVVAAFRSWGLDTYKGRSHELNEEETKTMIDTLLRIGE